MVAPLIASAGATAGRGLGWLLKNLVGKGSQLGGKGLEYGGRMGGAAGQQLGNIGGRLGAFGKRVGEEGADALGGLKGLAAPAGYGSAGLAGGAMLGGNSGEEDQILEALQMLMDEGMPLDQALRIIARQVPDDMDLG